MLNKELDGLGDGCPVLLEARKSGKDLVSGNFIDVGEYAWVLGCLQLQTHSLKLLRIRPCLEILEGPLATNQPQINTETNIAAGVLFLLDGERL